MSKGASQDLPWDEAIQQVLRDADGALHYAEIALRVASKGLRKNVGATPAATVAANLSQSLSSGSSSPYLRVGRGEYTLKELLQSKGKHSGKAAADQEQNSETGALRSFGMFWQRDLV